MQIQSPPLFEYLFLESPWAVMAVCVVAAVFLFTAGNRRHHKGLMAGSGIALVLTAGVYLLAWKVTTAHEQLIADTKALVAATAPLDQTTLDRLLDPNVVVTGPGGSVWVPAGQLMPHLQLALTRYPVNSQRIRTIQAEVRDNGWGMSAVIVHTEISGEGLGSVNTEWVLFWRHEPDTTTGPGRWRVVDIRWLKFNGVEVQQGLIP